MRWEEKQKRVEKSTYETIDTLAKKIGVDVPLYPGVFWIGRKFKDKYIGLPYRKGKIDCCLSNSKYLSKHNLILISEDNPIFISEEAGHFLHHNVSKIKLSPGYRDSKNKFALITLFEMFGFFCSKLIVPERKNNDYPEYKDYVLDITNKNVCDSVRNGTATYIIHQQGYELGEKLFNAHKNKKVSMKKIRNLFTNDLSGKDEPLSTFLELKDNFYDFFKKAL